MTRYIFAFAILFIAAVPVSIKPAWAVGALSVATGVSCLTGLVWRSLGAAVTGCGLAVIALALALWWSGTSMSVFGAVAFGLTLLLLLDSTHLISRFAGAAFDRPALRNQVAWWMARAAVFVGAAVLITVLASALRLFVPTSGRAILEAAGALAAIVAGLWSVLSRSERVS